MSVRSLLLSLSLFLLLSCSASKKEEPIVSSPYALDIGIVWNVDTSLVHKFNKYVVDDRVPELEKFGIGKKFEQIFPGLLLLSADFAKGSRAEAMSLCYDTVSGAFYVIVDNTFQQDFNNLVGDRFKDGISSEQAFQIAATAIFLEYRPRLMVCRTADLFLEQRIGDYIREAYVAKPGSPAKEFSKLWWGWSAFPLANNDYKNFYAAYRDSILEDEVLRDVPEGIFGMPKVEKDGADYMVTFFVLPVGPHREVQRYRVLVGSNGHLLKESSDVVFYY